MNGYIGTSRRGNNKVQINLVGKVNKQDLILKDGAHASCAPFYPIWDIMKDQG